MTSEFDSSMTAENAAFIAEFGETVTYTPTGAAGIEISAVITNRQKGRELPEDGTETEESATVFVQKSNVATVTVEKDTVTIGSDVFLVMSCGDAGGLWRLAVTLSVRTAAHADGLKR